MLILRASFVVAASLFVGAAYAQLPSPYVQVQPPITPGNCAKWYSNFAITDAGKTCGGAAPSSALVILIP